MKQQCAICFSGQVRTAERDSVKNNILNNLVYPFEELGYNVHFFGSSERKYGNWLWSDFKEVEDKNYWGEDLNSFNTRLGPGVKGGAFNVMNQWEKCKQVGLIKKDYEVKNDIIFDYVVRIRPDMVLDAPIKVDELSPLLYNIPNHDNWFGYNDRFCIGNSKIMDYYMIDFVDKIKEYFYNEDLTLHSETLLKHHLDKSGVGVHRPSFKIYFERPNGTEYLLTFN